MASDLNPATLQLTFEMQDSMNDVHSTDLEHSNNIQRDLSADLLYSSSSESLEYSSASSTTDMETSVSEACFNKSTLDYSISSEKKCHVQASVSKETLEVVKISTENQFASSAQILKDLPLSVEANTIQKGLSEVTESSEFKKSIFPEESSKLIQPAATEDTASPQIINSALADGTEWSELNKSILPPESESSELNKSILPQESESSELNKSILPQEFESTELILPAIPEDTVSPQVINEGLDDGTGSSELKKSIFPEESESSELIQPAAAEDTALSQLINTGLAEVIESTKEIQLPLPIQSEVNQTSISEADASNNAIKPVLSENAQSAKLIDPVRSEETELTEVKQPLVSCELNLNKLVPFDSSSNGCRKASTSSSNSQTVHFLSNDKTPSAIAKCLPEKVSDITIDSSNFQKNSGSSFPPALDTKSFLSLLNTEDYKNATHYLFPGKGQAIIAPLEPCEPIFLDFVMPPLSPPTNNPSMDFNQQLSPIKDNTIAEDKCLRKSLSILSRMLADWLQKNVEKNANNLQKPNFKDSVQYYKKELKFGLYLLKQMNDRIDSILKSVYILPDPSTFLPGVLESKISSIRESVINSGVYVQNRLKVIEAKTFETYTSFVSFYPSDTKVSDEFVGMQLVEKAKTMLFNSFLKLSEDIVKLNEDIGNCRDHIREFCLEFEKFL